MLEETERTERESIAVAEKAGDEPLRGIRMNARAKVVFQRGRVDETEELEHLRRGVEMDAYRAGARPSLLAFASRQISGP